MKRSLKYSDTKWKQYIEFLKQYLSMEEWFRDSNNKVEVINAQPQIAKVLQSLQHFFPKIYKHEWIQSSQNAWND
jgi:hypothetical protein